MAETVEVPFQQFGNRRGFTRQQLQEDFVAREFFERFKHCFVLDLVRDVVIFIEPEGEKDHD